MRDDIVGLNQQAGVLRPLTARIEGHSGGADEVNVVAAAGMSAIPKYFLEARPPEAIHYGRRLVELPMQGQEGERKKVDDCNGVLKKLKSVLHKKVGVIRDSQR